MRLVVMVLGLVVVVVQLNVKLFVFDNKTQSWLERGLGLLRLNDRCLPSDSESFQSRLGQYLTVASACVAASSLGRVSRLCVDRIYRMGQKNWRNFCMLYNFTEY